MKNRSLLTSTLLGLCSQVLVAVRLQGELIWEAAWSFSHVWQSQFQMDTPLVKADPISDSGSDWDNLVKKGKIISVQKYLWPEKWGVRICEKNNQQQRRSGRRCSRHQSRNIPAVLSAAHGDPWRSMEMQVSTSYARAEGYPKKAVTLWAAHAGAGSWQDLWLLGERSPCWNGSPGRTPVVAKTNS